MRFWSVICVCLLHACTRNGRRDAPDNHDIVRDPAFFQVTGSTIERAGAAVRLHGTSIANFAIWDWQQGASPYDWYVGAHDYANLSNWGADFVRLSLAYPWFGDDAQSFGTSVGVAYIDQHLAWAASHGLYVLIEMHIPPGGYQGYDLESAGARSFWTSALLRQQFVDLWSRLAARYRDEPRILGYGPDGSDHRRDSRRGGPEAPRLCDAAHAR
jgi:hypothetical protein